MRRALAVRQALMRMRSSMIWSLILPGSVDWRMNTIVYEYESRGGAAVGRCGELPSSSRTDSPIETLLSLFEYCSTITFASSIPSLYSLDQHFILRWTVAAPSIVGGPRNLKT